MTQAPAVGLKITDFLAIYAAVLSSAVFAWNILQSRARLKVVVVYGIEKDMGIGVHVSIQNRSSHTVHLSSVQLLHRYRKATWKERLSHVWRFKNSPRTVGWVHSSLSNLSIEDGCPLALEARNSHHVFIPDASLEKFLIDSVDRKIMVLVQDRIWNRVYSNVFQYQRPRALNSGA